MSEVKRHFVMAGSECSEMVYASDFDALYRKERHYLNRCAALEVERGELREFADTLEAERDALAQRCRELEDQRRKLSATMLNQTHDLQLARAEVERLRDLLKQAAALLPRDYQDEEALARKIDKEIAAWNAPTTGDTPAA